MEQSIVIANAIVYIIICFHYIKKYGFFNPGSLIFEFITLTAIFAIPAYNMLKSDFFFSRYNFSNVTILPYIYLLAVNMLSLKPFFLIPRKIEIKGLDYDFKLLLRFSYVYIFCAIISIYLNYRLLTSGLKGIEWNELRSMQYGGEALFAYNNLFERLFLSFTYHLRLVACIVFMLFYLFHKDRVKMKFIIVLLISIITPMFMDAMRTASRGMLITTIFQFSFLLGFFYKYVDRKKLIQVFIISGVFLFFAYIYSMAVTTSRFKETSGNESSLISYIGQPQIIFNSSIAGIESCWEGRYSLGNLYSVLGFPSRYTDTELGTKFIPCFTTIVGNFYCDFHVLGPFIFIGLIFLIFHNIYRKRTLTIADILLMYFLCLELQHGVLVMRDGFLWDTNVFIIIALYFLLSRFTRKMKRSK